MNEKFTEPTPTEKEAPKDNPESAGEESPSYLELKREYKDAKRSFLGAMEMDKQDRSGLKKMFGVGRDGISSEKRNEKGELDANGVSAQERYEEMLAAEKAYYQSFMETQKDKVETKINRGKFFEDQNQSIMPALIKRHIVNPGQERLKVEERQLPPAVQSVMKKITNKYTLGGAAALGIGMKFASIVSSFGVGLAAGAGTRWAFNKARTFEEKRLENKASQFQEMFESGELDDLGDIKSEYFQDLRKIDDVMLFANLTTAGVAVTAGTSFHDSELQTNVGEAMSEKVGEYWDATKDKVGSWFDKGEQPVTSDDTVVPEPSSMHDELTPEEKEQAHLDRVIEFKKEQIAASQAEMWADVAEAEDLAKKMGLTAEDVGEKLNFRMEGGVITEIEGRPVPEEYFSEADKQNIEAARQIGNVTSDDVSSEAREDALGVADEVFDAHFSDTATASEDFVGPPTPEAITGTLYEIQSGDTLSEIAEAHDVSIKEIMDANPEITNPHEIDLGQEIKIPEATGSAVYDQGVGLGGPLPEVSEVAVETAEVAEAVEQVKQPETQDYLSSPESAPMMDVLYGAEESEPPKEAISEVPDYSSPSNESQDSVNTQATPEVTVEQETPERQVSGVLREASSAEILVQQERVQEFLTNPLVTDSPAMSPKFLAEMDVSAGYEPLYTADLLERTIDAKSLTDSIDTENKLGLYVSLEMLNAYQADEINLPVQWVYLLDVLGDSQPEPNSVLEGSSDWDRKELRELSQLVSADLKHLSHLSPEQVKELGISSGEFENVRPGDEIKVGKIITMIMENASGRINR